MSVINKRLLKVFLCHAHADRETVRALYSRLIKDGVDAWLDKEKLLPGQDWELEIRQAVREADVVVVCLSRQFNQEGFRQKEVRLALDSAMEKPDGEIFIIPARLEECDTLESLRKWHLVDLFEEDGYERLTRALQTRADRIGVILQVKHRRSPKVPEPRKGEKLVSEKKLTEKPKNAKPQLRNTKALRKPNTAIIVALIGLVGTIIAGILSSPLIENLISPAPVITVSAAATKSILLPIVSPTNKPFITPSNTITVDPTYTATETITSTSTPFPADFIAVDPSNNKISMHLVPEGEFIMGVDNVQNARPAHRVFFGCLLYRQIRSY
jgi:hypothetical protein